MRATSSRSCAGCISRPRTSRAAAPCTTRSRASRPRSGISPRARSRFRCGSSSAAASATACASTPTATRATRSRATARRSCPGGSPWMGEAIDELAAAEPEVHWAPDDVADVYTPDAYAARASRDGRSRLHRAQVRPRPAAPRARGPLRADDLGRAARTPGRARASDDRGGRRPSRRRLRPALALRTGRRAPSRPRARGPAAALARGSDAAAGSRSRSRGSRSARRRRSAPARTSTASTASPR